MRKHRITPEKFLEFKEGPNRKFKNNQEITSEIFDADVNKLIDLQESWENSIGPFEQRKKWLELKAHAKRIHDYMDVIENDFGKAA